MVGGGGGGVRVGCGASTPRGVVVVTCGTKGLQPNSKLKEHIPIEAWVTSCIVGIYGSWNDFI